MTPVRRMDPRQTPLPKAARRGRRAAVIDLDALRLHFDDYPEPVIAADLKRRVVYCNPAAATVLGAPAAPLGSLPCAEIIGDATPHHCVIDQSLTAGRSLRQVPTLMRKAGGQTWSCLASTTLLKDPSGAPCGCLAIFSSAPDDMLAPHAIRTQLKVLSSLLKHYPIPLFTVNRDLTITYMNEPMERLSGYSSQEAVGRLRCAQVLRTPQCDTDDCLLKQSMKNMVPISQVRRDVFDREGRRIPVLATASVITDSSGNVVGGLEAIRDITPTVEAEQKIALLTEMTQEGILMTNEEHRVIFANSRMAEILGRPKEELLGRHAEDLLPQDYLSMMEGLHERFAQSHQQQVRFCGMIPMCSEGRQGCRSFETCMAVSRVGKSVITYLYFHDLTHRIEIESQLQKANSFLNNIIHNSVEGIVVLDTKGHVLLFNSGAERILGYKAEEVLGHPEVFDRIYEPGVARDLMHRMRSHQHGPPGKLNVTRITLLAKDGTEVPVNISAAIVKEGDQEVASVGIFSDLREHMRLQRELEEAHLQVLQAEKIASLGRLAAGVAHEINNPLAGILIYADILLKDIGHNPAWRQDLEEIITQTLRCKEIVTRLLEFSRRSLGQNVSFDVNALISQAVELISHQTLFQDIELVTDLEPDLPYVQGDPGQIRQVFTNLIINAADAMNGKGKLTIRSRADLETDQVVLRFADTGSGIPPEIVTKIFEPFFTTKPPGKGTGLGLSIAYGIIQRHGGNIEAESPAGGGAAFTISLPLTPIPELDGTG